MRLTVLNVAYPLAPVSEDAVGGAEQIVHHLDRGLGEAGHRSIVVAREDSRVSGTLVGVAVTAGELVPAAVAAAQARHRAAIIDALRRFPVDLVHMHGVDFHAYLPPPGVPVLATLHLPASFYPAEALRPRRPETWLHCVSRSHDATIADRARLLEPIENGVPFDHEPCGARQDYALVLGRICPEKGIHIAIEAAKSAGLPLLVAGEVFPYPQHRRYFAEEVQPRLDALRRFIGPVGLSRKQRLLAAARCLVAPSLVPETSSLSAREALAAGTPVVAFATGALTEVVDHGTTGFLVRNAAEMATAMRAVERIDPRACRAVARQRFSLGRMLESYLARYHALVAGARRHAWVEIAS